MVVDNDMVMLAKSDSGNMASYQFYDLPKKAVILPIVFIKSSDAYSGGRIISFKRKKDDAVFVTALYAKKADNSMMIKSWLIKPNNVAGVIIPALIGPGDVTDDVMFSYIVDNAAELTMTGSDCSGDGAYAAFSYATLDGEKNSKVHIWNRNAKTWSEVKFKFKFDIVQDVEALSFNDAGYLMLYFDVTGKQDGFFVVNPLNGKKVLSQTILAIGDFDETLVFSRNGGLYAMTEYSGQNAIRGRTTFTIHKTKTGKVLASFQLPSDAARGLSRDLAGISAKLEFYESDNGIQAIDATPDFRYVSILSVYKNIVADKSVESGYKYEMMNQYFDVYDLGELIKEDDLGLKPLM
jgi:hypothetical protein